MTEATSVRKASKLSSYIIMIITDLLQFDSYALTIDRSKTWCEPMSWAVRRSNLKDENENDRNGRKTVKRTRERCNFSVNLVRYAAFF